MAARSWKWQSTCSEIDIRYSTVADLIDAEIFIRKREVIKNLFGDEQLEKMLLIPLVNSAQKDQVV